MRIDLGQLSAERLDLDLGRLADGEGQRRILLERVVGLAGTLLLEADALTLSGVRCETARLAPSELALERVRVVLESAGELSGLTGELTRRAGRLQLTVHAQALRGAKLRVSTGGLEVVGELDGGELALTIDGPRGELRATSAQLTEGRATAAGSTLELPLLRGRELVVRWGEGPLEIELGSFEAEHVGLLQAEAQLQAERVQGERLELHGGVLQLASLRADAVELDAPWPARAAAEGPAAPRAQPLWTTELLDGLGGQLDVDVAVDAVVPVLGHRRVTHALRIPIADGALNYRTVEHSLASLEDSLFDFSVREGALVLERGLPLVPTRGRGTPIVFWPLAPSDLALAEQHRVRLAVLPNVVRAGAARGERQGAEEASSISLRSLGFLNVVVALSLRAPERPWAAALNRLSFTRGVVRGQVEYDAERPARRGLLQLQFEGVAAQLAELPLGGRALSAQLELARIGDGELTFAGVRPAGLRARLEGLSLSALRLG